MRNTCLLLCQNRGLYKPSVEFSTVDTPVYYFKTWWINIKLCFSYVGQVKSINVLNMNWDGIHTTCTFICCSLQWIYCIFTLNYVQRRLRVILQFQPVLYKHEFDFLSCELSVCLEEAMRAVSIWNVYISGREQFVDRHFHFGLHRLVQMAAGRTSQLRRRVAQVRIWLLVSFLVFSTDQ